MPVIEYGNLKINIDEECYLLNFDDWNELAVCAGDSGINKRKAGYFKIHRDYYKKYNYFPILNTICLNVHQPKNCITQQFVNPIQVWKLASLPKLDNEIRNILEGQTPG